MRFELMVGGLSWQRAASLARSVEEAGFSGMVFTETTQTPWMSLAAAAQATSQLDLSTGIAVAFARSPMVTSSLAWELAENSRGRFRLGLGSQVRAHVERRYGAAFDPPGPRLRDYVEAVRACFDAFAGRRSLQHDGPYYKLSLLPEAFSPRRHAYGDIKIDVAAVNEWMCRMAGSVADGVHVHPLHSLHYIRSRLLPAVAEGAATAGRRPEDLEVTVPVFAVGGNSEEDRRPLVEEARRQVAFYGSTRNYAFQFEDLGYPGTSERLNERLKAGDLDGMRAVVTDEMLAQFAVVESWRGLPDALLHRYGDVADRLVMYLAASAIERDSSALRNWAEVARAVTTA